MSHSSNTTAAATAAAVLDNGTNEGTTLTQYLMSVARERVNSLEGEVRHSIPISLSTNPTAQESVMDLITLLQSIKLAVTTVGTMVRSAGLPTRNQGNNNSASSPESAEDTRRLFAELNAAANDEWITALSYSQRSCVLVSEDLADPFIVEEDMQGRYAVVFDPLTGLGDPPAQDMGAIFGVFAQLSEDGSEPSIADVMQPARNLVAAGYALYGSCTVMMFSAGNGVQQFTLDPSLNEFILTEKNVTIPLSGEIYSINEGYTSEYDSETQEMLKCFKAEPTVDGLQRTCRYSGSMVADIHRTFLKGGIFMYPKHKRGFPNGRLKLLYEAGPMAFLTTQAHGMASTGTQNIIDVVPDSIHTRVPVFLGSEDEVNFATGFYRTAPWGRTDQDPMFKLRRTLSIEEKKRKAESSDCIINSGANQSYPDQSYDDGIICSHVG